MNDLYRVWKFTRFRLDQARQGLSVVQLRWRPQQGAHCIGEILYHIAGAEHYWWARMTGNDPAASDLESKLDRAIIDGFLREAAFPFSEEEVTLEDTVTALDLTGPRIEGIYAALDERLLSVPIVSPVGDHVDGHEGLVRLAQHAGYHTGQIWMIRMNPDFPD